MKSQQVQAAARQLRSALGLTQTEFAKRIGKGIATVQRYETQSAPSGPVLNRLAELAESQGLQDLAAVFRQALELNSSPALSHKIEFKNDEERDWTAALLAAFRNPQYADSLRRVQGILKPIRERCQQILDAAQEFQDALYHRMAQRLDSGEQPQAILEDLKREYGVPGDRFSKLDAFMMKVLVDRGNRDSGGVK